MFDMSGRSKLKLSSVDNPLHAALQSFQAALTPEENDQLRAYNESPDANAVIKFIVEVDRANEKRRSRCISSRLFNFLESVQQFSAVVDTFVSSHPSVAALVWGSIRFTIVVCAYVPLKTLSC